MQEKIEFKGSAKCNVCGHYIRKTFSNGYGRTVYCDFCGTYIEYLSPGTYTIEKDTNGKNKPILILNSK